MSGNPPTESFKIWPFSVALWERDGRQFVSVSKSQKTDDGYEDQLIWLNLSEVSCVAGLLKKMERTISKLSEGEGE